MGSKSRVEFVFEFSLRVIWMYVNWTFTFLNYLSLSEMLDERRYITRGLLLLCACAGALASVYFAGVVQCVAGNMFRRKGRQQLTEVPLPRPMTRRDAMPMGKSQDAAMTKSRRRKTNTNRVCPKRIVTERKGYRAADYSF